MAQRRVVAISDWRANAEQKRLVQQVLDTGRLTYGPMSRALEERFAAIHGWEHAIFTNSGTNALKLCLAAFKERNGWPDGGEVVIPAVTFIATYTAVRMAGLTPRLVDVGEDFNIDAEEARAATTKNTVAAIPVHLLGRPASVLEMRAGLTVIEDSCEAMFVDTGSKGAAACYSTYVAHHLVTGTGGFVCTNDGEIATLLRSLMFHGRDPAYLSLEDNAKPGIEQKRFLFPRFGYSDRPTELQAALGLGGLADGVRGVQIRQGHAAYLAERLGVEYVEGHAYLFFPLMHPRRDDLMAHLEARGIATRELMPLTNQPVFRGRFQDPLRARRGELFPVADRVNREGLLLPCHQYLDVEDLDWIVDSVLAFDHARVGA